MRLRARRAHLATCRIAQAIRRFADEQKDKVHVGLFAYAPGGGRELRLAAAMDAIVRSLGASIVRSVTCLVSPTSPAEMLADDVQHASSRAAKHPFWQSVLERTWALRGPGSIQAHAGAVNVARAVVSLQGPGYLAAQYLSKIVSAESLAVHGLDIEAPDTQRVIVSANVAGITATRSLEHPLFLAAFRAAPKFDIRIFEPGTTRALSSALMVHDLLHANAPGNPSRTFATSRERAGALRSQQLHGGVYNVPWKFEECVRAAAVIGLAQHPSVLWRRKRA